jgi:hypothetical protein
MKRYDDETAILAWFAHFLEEDGIDGLAEYIAHCKIKMVPGLTAGDAILAHYRNPLGYDIERAAMDLRAWPPIASRIFELQSSEAERRATGATKRKRVQRAASSMNDHAVV